MNAWDWLLYYFTPVAWQDVVWFVLGASFTVVLAIHYRRRIRRLVIRVADLRDQVVDADEARRDVETELVVRREVSEHWRNAARAAQQRERRRLEKLERRACSAWTCGEYEGDGGPRPCKRLPDHLGPCDPYAAPECLPGCDDDHHDSGCPNSNVGTRVQQPDAVRMDDGQPLNADAWTVQRRAYYEGAIQDTRVRQAGDGAEVQQPEARTDVHACWLTKPGRLSDVGACWYCGKQIVRRQYYSPGQLDAMVHALMEAEL